MIKNLVFAFCSDGGECFWIIFIHIGKFLGFVFFQIFAGSELCRMAGQAFRTAAEALTNDTKGCGGLALSDVKQVAHPVALAVEITWKLFTIVST